MKRSQYEAIEKEAEKHGGVGSGRCYELGEPWCVIGIAHAAGVLLPGQPWHHTLEADLMEAGEKLLGVSIAVLDETIRSTRLAFTSDLNVRVPFDLVAARLDLRVED